MRLAGFYKVRHKAYGLTIAEFTGFSWEIPGVLYSVPESDLSYISKRRINL